jgi:hypothetical protein
MYLVTIQNKKTMNNEKQPSPNTTNRTPNGFPEGSSITAGNLIITDNRSTTLESLGINGFHDPYKVMNEQDRLSRLERAYGLSPDASDTQAETQTEEENDTESPTIEDPEKFDMKHKHSIETFGRGALNAIRISVGTLVETGPENLAKMAGIKTKETALFTVDATREAAALAVDATREATAKVAETAAKAAEKLRLNHIRFKKYVNVIRRAQHVNSLKIRDTVSNNAQSTKKYVDANSSGALDRAKHVKKLREQDIKAAEKAKKAAEK